MGGKALSFQAYTAAGDWWAACTYTGEADLHSMVELTESQFK
jgi:hypothetical protein